MSMSEPPVPHAQVGRSHRATRDWAANRRLDPPHSVSHETREGTPGEPAPAPRAFPDEVPASDRLTLQAEQIAAHLRLRQDELDHREAELNSLAARLESDARSARLWLNEREAELAARHDETARLHASLAARQPVPSRSRAAESLEVRKRRLDEAESRIAVAQTDIKRMQEELLAQRRAFQAEVVATRRQLDDQRRRSTAELESKRDVVRRRGEHVDRCRAALAQTHAELQRAQRETLEVHLATEELWAQLSGAAPPAALTRSLGRIRARLAEHNQRVDAELTQRRKELEGLRAQLSEQHAKLLERKRRLEEWAARQREEIDQQASRLLAREQQLNGQESGLREQSQSWRNERLEYQQEIRRLRAELAAPTEAGAAAPCPV
jgi:hypothetical protein